MKFKFVLMSTKDQNRSEGLENTSSSNRQAEKMTMKMTTEGNIGGSSHISGLSQIGKP
jgi:hypothetical protein